MVVVDGRHVASFAGRRDLGGLLRLFFLVRPAAATRAPGIPVFTKITFDVDIEERKGRVSVEGYFETTGEPIRNPVTGDPHRMRIDLPHGFEYSIAEVGSASSNVRGPIPLTLKNSYGQCAYLHLNNHGPIRG